MPFLVCKLSHLLAMAWPNFKNYVVYTNSTLSFTLPTMPCMAKGVKVVYLVNKSKPVC